MRTRTEEINVRVYKTEKNTIRRKAKKCGMNMSEYLRTLGTGAAVREAPRWELMLAYQKLTTLHDTVRYELAMRDFDEAPVSYTHLSDSYSAFRPSMVSLNSASVMPSSSMTTPT